MKRKTLYNSSAVCCGKDWLAMFPSGLSVRLGAGPGNTGCSNTAGRHKTDRSYHSTFATLPPNRTQQTIGLHFSLVCNSFQPDVCKTGPGGMNGADESTAGLPCDALQTRHCIDLSTGQSQTRPAFYILYEDQTILQWFCLCV